MFVYNHTSFPLIAFCWSVEPHFGTDTYIMPDQGVEVLLDTTDLDSRIVRDIHCYEISTNPEECVIGVGSPLIVRSALGGISIRHYHNERDWVITLTLPRMKHGS